MDKDINKEIQEKQDEMFLNKKKLDLDKAMESLLDFYSKYSTNKIAEDMNNKICVYHGVSPNSEQGKIFYNTITTFFFLGCDELKKVVTANIEPLKERLGNMPDNDYIKALEYLSTTITNYMSDYYVEKLDMLSNELNQNVNMDTKNRINKYIFEVLTVKMVNTLKDKFMYAIGVINNNNQENYKVMETIKEKTINKK